MKKSTKSSLDYPEIPLQQTPAWQNLQNDLKETSFFEKTADFQFLAIKKSTPLGTYLYLPYGPYVRTKNASKTAYKALKALAEREHAIFIRIEPQSPEIASYFLKQPNCRKSHDLNPHRTWALDLTPEKDQIIKNFATSTRRCHKDAPKKGLSVELSQNPEKDIKYLIKFQNKLAKTKNIGTFSPEYLKTEAIQPFSTLYLARYHTPENPPKIPKNSQNTIKPRPKPKNGQVIAALLFFENQTTRFYMQGAEIPEYKYLPASVACMTAAMFDAKQKGLKKFDFWGIAPENASKNHPWNGFTRFKKSFGGYPLEYAGTHDLIFNYPKYHAYQILRSLNRLKRKFF